MLYIRPICRVLYKPFLLRYKEIDMNMKLNYLAVAVSAIFATAALTGCGSDSDNNYNPPTTTPPVVTPPVVTPPVVTPPEGPVAGGEDNTGEAAEGNLALNTKSSVGGQQYVRGDDAEFDRALNPSNTTSGNATVLNGVTLQNKKLDNIVVGRETVQREDGSKAIIRLAGKAIDGLSKEAANDTLQLQEHNANNGINVTSGNFEKNGLVLITKNNATDTFFTVRGQENQSNGLATSNGSRVNTRIFGNKYLSDNNAEAVNSHRFTGKANVNGVISTVADFDVAKNYSPIKLNNVQYGRITSNIDKLNDAAFVDGKTYYESEISGAADRQRNLDDTVDTYFYRGTNETTIAQMNALQAKGGSVNYAGHALMYGIDNSYHGNLGDTNSNAPGALDTAVQAAGNFVQATVNMGDRTIAGNIFNVWEIAPAQGGDNLVKQDNLVNFSGKVFGNTAKGTSQLAYGSDKNPGTFKGSFYGEQAQELGGSVNSVTTGYGNPAWGGVFGANQVIPENNANQTE